MADAYDLFVAFDRATADFARGVEVGMVQQRLCTEPLPVSATMHVTNVEMAMRMAEAHECQVRAEPLSDDWLAVRFG
jgi:hypothetical protein